MRGDARTLGLATVLGALLMVGCGSSPPPSPTSSGVHPTVSPAATPGSSQTAAPTNTPAAERDLLPTPSTTDVVLLVSDAAALTAREQQWLSDLRADLGRVDAMPYRQVTFDRLGAYFTVFVIDQDAELDVEALGQAFAAGLTIHLVGPAAGYQAQVAGGAP